MLRNYFLLATRSLVKNRIFTIVNIAGLSFGLTCAILISLWIWDELRFDSFHEKGQSIHQLFGEMQNEGESLIVPYAPSSLVEPILEEIPEIIKISRAFPANVVFETPKAKFPEKGLYADSSLLSIFSFPLKEGEIHNILSRPQTVVLSQKLAEKYFPGSSALGKYIEIIEAGNEKSSFEITGVLETIPVYSSLQFDYIIAYDRFEDKFRPWWKKSNEHSFTNFNVSVYAELVKDVNTEALNKKLGSFITDFTGQKTDNEIFAYPFADLYLHSDFSQGRIPTGKIQYVNFLSVIAIIVLMIACINFMNLSTAIAGKRAKEVGLRKVVGAYRRQIIFQFLIESILISTIALVLAMVLVEMFMPYFNVITHKSIHVPFRSIEFIFILISISVVTGILAGGYPAFYLAAFKPSDTLSNANASRGAFSGIRKGLVIVQFTLSIIFIVFTIVVFKQIDFFQNKELGIKKENIIHHALHGIERNKTSYRDELSKIPGVKSVSFTEQNPLNISNGNPGVNWSGKPENAEIYFSVMQVGEGFLETFEIELIDGRGFPEQYSEEGEKYFLINEKAAATIQQENPVGMNLQVWGQEGKVVGLVKDFHHKSLAQNIEPVVIIYNPSQVFSAFISFETSNIPELLNSVKSAYGKYESDFAFDYSFVEDQYQAGYSDVITIGRLGSIFSVAAILISCLGLFGLSAFIAEQRTKETGIRKVLGASELSLLKLFSAGFIKLVVLSFIIAMPLAWIYSNYWLSSYAYRIEIGYTPFILSGIFAILIALLTVSYNTLRAASANPVDSLKYE